MTDAQATPTPRTDSFEEGYWSEEQVNVRDVFNFARQLERRAIAAEDALLEWKRASSTVGTPWKT